MIHNVNAHRHITVNSVKTLGGLISCLSHQSVSHRRYHRLLHWLYCAVWVLMSHWMSHLSILKVTKQNDFYRSVTVQKRR